jgi:hypothetical protein
MSKRIAASDAESGSAKRARNDTVGDDCIEDFTSGESDMVNLFLKRERGRLYSLINTGAGT